MDDDRDPLLDGEEPVEIDGALLPEEEDDDALVLDDDGNLAVPDEEEDPEAFGFTTKEEDETL